MVIRYFWKIVEKCQHNPQVFKSSYQDFLIESQSFNQVLVSKFWSKLHLRFVAHQAFKKGVCSGRAAFDVTFQHESMLSIKTRNRPMNFVMLPKYHISKILPIYSISTILAHKAAALVFCTEYSETQAATVAAELRFCPLLHIDRLKTRNNTLPDLFDLSTVCVHNNSCISRKIEVRSC